MKKLLSLLIFCLILLSISCEPGQKKETTQLDKVNDKHELLPLSESETVKLYSIAFDSLFGSPEY